MSERKAIYYGEVKLVPSIVCEAYVLDNELAVMSEKGTAKLLGMARQSLNNMSANWPPKYLEPFIDNDLSMSVKMVKVIANKSPYKGRKIAVYSSSMIENLIFGYALAFANDCLRKNQKHIGRVAITLMKTLVRNALSVAIKEACGFLPSIQESTQKDYNSAVKLIQEFGFRCSIPGEIATKKDIINFLKIPAGTLNSFLYKHSSEIKPVKLNYEMIQASGHKARRMNGYHIKDVAKIAFGTDTATGIKLKQRMFGEIATIARLNVKDEIKWRKTLTDVFCGYDLRFNHSIGSHRLRVDFFVADLLLCLECNGYSHCHYNPEWEVKREKIITEKYALIRFHHETQLECLFNAVLKAQPGKVIRLYDNKNVTLRKFLSNT